MISKIFGFVEIDIYDWLQSFFEDFLLLILFDSFRLIQRKHTRLNSVFFLNIAIKHKLLAWKIFIIPWIDKDMHNAIFFRRFSAIEFFFFIKQIIDFKNISTRRLIAIKHTWITSSTNDTTSFFEDFLLLILFNSFRLVQRRHTIEFCLFS